MHQIITRFLQSPQYDRKHTGKPSSLSMSLLACNIPVYFELELPHTVLVSKAH